MSFINGAFSTDVVINATGVLPGEYTLVLESFDTNSELPELTLKTDAISISVTSEILPTFTEELTTKVLTAGEPDSWQLPLIYDGTYPLDHVLLEADTALQPYISFKSLTRTIVFSGDEASA